MWLRSSGLPLHGRRRIERSAVFVAWLAGPGGTSSLRTQGPILRGCCCWKRRTIATSQDNFGRWLWVPAFAGTTKEISDSIQKKVTHLRDLAAHCARGLHLGLPSRTLRAQGRPGARCTRGLVCNCAQRTRTRAYRFSGSIPAFPAQWLYGLLRALPGERLFCHRRPQEACFSRA